MEYNTVEHLELENKTVTLRYLVRARDFLAKSDKNLFRQKRDLRIETVCYEYSWWYVIHFKISKRTNMQFLSIQQEKLLDTKPGGPHSIPRTRMVGGKVDLLPSDGCIWFYPKSLRYLFSGSWSPKQFLVWVPSPGMDLKSNQIMVGYCHKLYAIIALAYLAGMVPFRSMGLWLSWCLPFFFGSMQSSMLYQSY